ncbi:unnamed protein product [Darwinula stevensoni]|uniref:Peptidase S1 domain-containing protein n=1 Tax=Darwinula stevensoni TaxID=69355 RepID=A0A7R9A662_9CRUS|nr:unnamed protein product [Darwinula stevensoni]CAG0888169.1 unnamed protein product [Darwinula stevensoni]
MASFIARDVDLRDAGAPFSSQEVRLASPDFQSVSSREGCLPRTSRAGRPSRGDPDVISSEFYGDASNRKREVEAGLRSGESRRPRMHRSAFSSPAMDDGTVPEHPAQVRSDRQEPRMSRVNATKLFQRLSAGKNGRRVKSGRILWARNFLNPGKRLSVLLKGGAHRASRIGSRIENFMEPSSGSGVSAGRRPTPRFSYHLLQFPNSTTPLVCGVSQADSRSGTLEENSTAPNLNRIIGGTPVPSQKKYPWMAWMGSAPRTFNCGGSLINDRYVLTASHCVESNTTRTFYVTLGDLDKSTSSESQSIQIEATAIMHPEYDTPTWVNNDVAILRLETPVDFQAYPHIRPICLSSSVIPNVGDAVTIAGWGRTEENGGPHSMTMLETTVKVISATTCRNWFGSAVNNNFLCAQETGKNICNKLPNDSCRSRYVEYKGREAERRYKWGRGKSVLELVRSAGSSPIAKADP